MERNDFNSETLGKLSALEQREYVLLMNHPDYLKWPHHIQEAAKRFPPFYLYKLKSTGQIVRITEYNDKKHDLEFPVMFKVLIDPEFNELSNTKLKDMSFLSSLIDRKLVDVSILLLSMVLVYLFHRQCNAFH